MNATTARKSRPATRANRGTYTRALRRSLKMPRKTFARLVPMSERSLAGIEAGQAPSRAVVRRLRELDRISKALAEVIDKDAVGAWLEEPNPAFRGLKPLEVIERGEGDRLWEMIYLLRSGTPS